jgi:hypothetical protein
MMRRKKEEKDHETFVKVPDTTMQNKCEGDLERGIK